MYLLLTLVHFGWAKLGVGTDADSATLSFLPLLSPANHSPVHPGHFAWSEKSQLVQLAELFLYTTITITSLAIT